MNQIHINKSKPIRVSLILLLLCVFLRILDILVFRLDELFGGIIISKILGFLLILFYVKFSKSKIREIGLHTKRLSGSFEWGLVFVIITLLLSYGTQFLFLLINNAAPLFVWNEYTWLQLVLFVLIGNVINSLMEEGLFRGILFQGFMRRWSFWVANGFQAFLFGLWHIIGPIKQYTIGQLSLGGAIMNALIYTICSGIIGFLMGYLFYATSNLWICIVWHTIWNTCLNILSIQSATLAINNPTMAMSTNAFWISFTIAALLTMLFLHKRKSYIAHLTAKYYTFLKD
jgi:uncharacterized protein